MTAWSKLLPRRSDATIGARGLSQAQSIALLALLLVAVVVVAFVFQHWVEKDLHLVPPIASTAREQYEITKLAAEIRQIRSDTAGSLFWLKIVALFVTVGGAIGGYLVGQQRTTKSRLDFERRKLVDGAYQSILQELAGESPLLRGAAAVKLGNILRNFPSEWECTGQRQTEVVELTKSVLAASMAAEKDPKVLKILAASLMMHRHLDRSKLTGDAKIFADVRGIDLSLAHADDAYWARGDFTESDFYRAELNGASFRNSILDRAQFREAKLCRAVLAGAICIKASFKLADLRDADLRAASFQSTDFEGARVHGALMAGARWGTDADGREDASGEVDLSPTGDGTQMVTVREWRTQAG